MNDQRDKEVQQRVRTELEAKLETLDANVAARLSAARHRALDQLTSKPRWQPVAGWAVAATLVVTVSLWWQQSPSTANGISPDDFELLVSGDGIELYEDLEFYDWLSSENDAS
jgi:hypothetical protein